MKKMKFDFKKIFSESVFFFSEFIFPFSHSAKKLLLTIYYYLCRTNLINDMKVHFIAIGGSAMHNLAIALKLKGCSVSGSDDEIFEPARSRLKKYSLLPEQISWHPEKLDNSIDAVILGMHAKNDNPELLRAKELGLKIYSYPEFLYRMSKDKTRIVVGGSHGKTTITAMILHAMKTLGKDTDYMVGAQLEGFEVMVRMSDEAKYMVLEGDEYLSSVLDPRPKFHLYKPNVAIINGIAWDHINVFPTFDKYVEQFKLFADKIEPNGVLLYYEGDENARRIGLNARKDIRAKGYGALPYRTENGRSIVQWKGREYVMRIFGQHNLINLNAAMLACEQTGIDNGDFLQTMTSFSGASKRLEAIKITDTQAFYSDFAHSPSKLKATCEAVKKQYPSRRLVACLELHTFSSLTKEFLVQYKNCMDSTDCAAVYYNRHAIELKRLPDLSEEAVYEAFGKKDLKVLTDIEAVKEFILTNTDKNSNVLMMSSSNFGGLDLKELAQNVM